LLATFLANSLKVVRLIALPLIVATLSTLAAGVAGF